MDSHDDAKLSAYLDGELPPEELREFEERLAGDAGLRTRLDAMRAADNATRTLFAAVDAAPMPDAIVQMLASPAANNVVALPQRGVGRFLQMPVAIAASLALAVGFIVSELAREAPGPATGIESLSARSIDAGSGLYQLLEASTSGQVTDLGDGARGEALLTFEDTAGRFCRQLRVDMPDSAAHAVACRSDGTWQVAALAYADAAGGQFQPAAGSTPASIKATVDSLIGAAEPLEKEQETAIISNSWKKSE